MEYPLAVVSCPECRDKVSDAAATCPHCGYPMVDTAVAQASAPIPQAMAGTATYESRPSVALTESEIWFSYRGRIGVGQYWRRFLAGLVAFFVIAFMAYSSTGTLDGVETVDGFLAIAYLFAIWPSTALAWKRLHDTGRSGGYFFLVLIPLAGPIIWLVFSLQQSSPGPNEFGPRAGYRYTANE